MTLYMYYYKTLKSLVQVNITINIIILVQRDCHKDQHDCGPDKERSGHKTWHESFHLFLESFNY